MIIEIKDSITPVILQFDLGTARIFRRLSKELTDAISDDPAEDVIIRVIAAAVSRYNAARGEVYQYSIEEIAEIYYRGTAQIAQDVMLAFNEVMGVKNENGKTPAEATKEEETKNQ